jgi:alkyl hydroperoxide reductase subunit F
MLYDVIIIGAGPAGMSAAVYTARKNLKTLILSKDIGGQTAISWEVDNYLGFHLVSGQELSKNFKEHVDKFDNVKLKIGELAEEIEKIDGEFKVKSAIGEYETKAIIIASGKEPRKLNVAGEKKFLGKGITYCATCDGPLFKGKDIAIIGGGNSALESVVQLSKICPTIYLINNQDVFAATADQVLVDKVQNDPKVKILHNANTKEFIGDKFLTQIKVDVGGQEKILNVKGGFIEIGSIPSVSFIKDKKIGIKLNEWNEIKINKKNMTSIEGIFAAGDVTDVLEKQVVIAAGEGAKAAMQAAEWLNRR